MNNWYLKEISNLSLDENKTKIIDRALFINYDKFYFFNKYSFSLLYLITFLIKNIDNINPTPKKA